jgi:hypothetical protein
MAWNFTKSNTPATAECGSRRGGGQPPIEEGKFVRLTGRGSICIIVGFVTVLALVAFQETVFGRYSQALTGFVATLLVLLTWYFTAPKRA